MASAETVIGFKKKLKRCQERGVKTRMEIKRESAWMEGKQGDESFTPGADVIKCKTTVSIHVSAHIRGRGRKDKEKGQHSIHMSARIIQRGQRKEEGKREKRRKTGGESRSIR